MMQNKRGRKKKIGRGILRGEQTIDKFMLKERKSCETPDSKRKRRKEEDSDDNKDEENMRDEVKRRKKKRTEKEERKLNLVFWMLPLIKMILQTETEKEELTL